MTGSSASSKLRRYAVVPRGLVATAIVASAVMAVLFVAAATGRNGLGSSMEAFVWLALTVPAVIMVRRMSVLLGPQRVWINSVFQCVSVALDRVDVDGVRQLLPDAGPYIVEWDKRGFALGVEVGWGRDEEGRRVFSLVNAPRPVLIRTLDDFDVLVSVRNPIDFVVQLRAQVRRAQLAAAGDQEAVVSH